jgi:hypothetical protein
MVFVRSMLLQLAYRGGLACVHSLVTLKVRGILSFIPSGVLSHC